MQETVLIESRQIRDRAIERIEVLEKVKALFLIPKMNAITLKQVADYYEVPVETVLTCYKRNQKEIEEDGVCVKYISDFLKVQYEPIRRDKGKTTFQLSQNVCVEIPNRGIRVFPQRAILRIGMLLRDSVIAKEVRTQLLNTFEEATPEQRTKGIDEELAKIYSKVDSLEYTVKQMIDNTTINSRQAQKLLFAAKDRVNYLLGGAHSAEYKANSRMYFKNLWLNLCGKFNVGSYKDLNPTNLNAAMEYIHNWVYVSC